MLAYIPYMDPMGNGGYAKTYGRVITMNELRVILRESVGNGGENRGPF